MGIVDFIKDRALIAGIIICVFIAGWLGSAFYYNTTINFEKPLNDGFISTIPSEKQSPGDHLKQEQIHVYSNKVVIDLDNPRWAEFADTNSMDPVIDSEANSIEIIPNDFSEIKTGDIISYDAGKEGIIIHRVMNTSFDNEGWYCITKGDNLKYPDPIKVRFKDIKGIVVGILY